MENKQITLGSGLSTSIQKLRIPIYQRPYSWGDEQINKLLSDCYDAYKAGKDGYYHYLGTISLVEKENSNTFDVLDGQQRLTTLTLLAAWLKHHLSSDIFDKFLLPEGKLRLEFQTRDNLKEAFRKFVVNGESSFNEDFFLRFKSAITCFETFFQDKRDDLNTFSNWLASNVILFISIVPRISAKSQIPQSLYKYYDAINTAGKQLEKTDVLKAKLLEKIHIGGKKTEDLSKAFNAALNPFEQVKRPFQVPRIVEDSFASGVSNEDLLTDNTKVTLADAIKDNFKFVASDQNEKNNEPKRHLVHGWDLAVMAYNIVSHNPLHVNNKDQKWNNVSVDDIVNGFSLEESIIYIRILYTIRFYLDDFFIQPNDSTLPEIRAKSMSGTNILVQEEDDDCDEDIEDRTKDDKRSVRLLQAALYGSTLEIHKWVFPALKFLIGKTEENVLVGIQWNEFYDAINNTEKERARGYFEVTITKDMVYGSDYVRYYLNMIDYLLAKQGLQSPKGDKMKFTARNSVEHIVSQNPKDEEGNSLQLPDGFDLNHVSNLALLTSYRNSTYQNHSFDHKSVLFIKYSQENSYYESLRLKAVYGIDIKENRYDKLREIAKEHDDLFQAWMSGS